MRMNDDEGLQVVMKMFRRLRDNYTARVVSLSAVLLFSLTLCR